MSASVIHRLENASGAVTTSALFRYAAALQVHPKDLFDFELPSSKSTKTTGSGKISVLPLDHPRVAQESFQSLLPLYSLRAAAGYFGSGESVEPEGWIEIPGRPRLDSKMFVARAVGDSLEPRIQSGDLLVFRADPVGSRQGKIVLVQYRGPADPETGGSYTVKVYRSSKVVSSDSEWRHGRIVLAPLNPEYEEIILDPEREDDLKVVAEYLFKIG